MQRSLFPHLKKRVNTAFEQRKTGDITSPVSSNLLEYTGFEPVASTMRMWRAPSCANTPDHVIREAGLPASRWKQRGSNP